MLKIIDSKIISKIFLIPKILELFTTKNLSLFMFSFICNNQHGFRHKMSISTNILLFQRKILSALNERI